MGLRTQGPPAKTGPKGIIFGESDWGSVDVFWILHWPSVLWNFVLTVNTKDLVRLRHGGRFSMIQSHGEAVERLAKDHPVL